MSVAPYHMCVEELDKDILNKTSEGGPQRNSNACLNVVLDLAN